MSSKFKVGEPHESLNELNEVGDGRRPPLQRERTQRHQRQQRTQRTQRHQRYKVLLRGDRCWGMNVKFIKGDWVRLPMAAGKIREGSARGDVGGDTAARCPCPRRPRGCTKVTIIPLIYDNSTNITYARGELPSLDFRLRCASTRRVGAPRGWGSRGRILTRSLGPRGAVGSPAFLSPPPMRLKSPNSHLFFQTHIRDVRMHGHNAFVIVMYAHPH